MLFRRSFSAIVICLVGVILTGYASASIVVPEMAYEFSAVGDLDKADDSGAASSAPTSDNRNPDQPAPAPPGDDEWRLAFSSYSWAIGSTSTGSMSGSGTSPFGSGSGDLVAATASGLHINEALVGWLSQSRWLDIPIPQGISLLRPPQVV